MFRLRFLAMFVLALMPLAAHAQDGWFLFRGNPQRTGAASSMAAWPKRPAWQRPLLLDNVQELMDADGRAKDMIDKLGMGADPTIMPGFFPLMVKGMCVYRSHVGICAVTLEGHSLRDEVSGRVERYEPSEIIWKSVRHVASLSELLNKHPSFMQKSIAMLRANKQEAWLWANPTIGSLSSDGKEIFAIDDVVLPSNGPAAPARHPFLFGGLSIALDNNLDAYESTTGKLTWETTENPHRGSPLARSHFLGAPLPLDGKLYGLNESPEGLRLVVLKVDPKDVNAQGLPAIQSTLALMKIPAAEQILKSPLRRTQPLHIAEANGLLVCPTNLGVLVGVDRAKMAVRWRYEYRDQKIPAPPVPFWQAAGPIIHKDCVVFTAADAPQIHCLDLDGKKRWTAAKDNDLYLATVHDGLVLLVGKTHCRALNLADGKEKWKLEMGLPAGVGVLDGSHYYVPLKRDAVTKRPTLWAIDLGKGKKAHRLEVPYPDALGNLALHRGMFVSQSVTHVAAFPLVKAP